MDGGDGATLAVSMVLQSTNDHAYRPEVVHQHIEHTQQQHKQDRAELGLESHHDHHTGEEAEQRNDDTAKSPVSRKDKSNKQEYQQHSPAELDVHLLVLLVDVGQSRKGARLLHRGVAEHHEQSPRDRQVTQEEVQVEDQAVAEGLHDHDRQETADGVFRVAAHDHQRRAGRHGDHVEDQEHVCQPPGNYTPSGQQQGLSSTTPRDILCRKSLRYSS